MMKKIMSRSVRVAVKTENAHLDRLRRAFSSMSEPGEEATVAERPASLQAAGMGLLF